MAKNFKRVFPFLIMIQQIPILLDLIIIMAAAILTVNLVNRIRMPAIVGFLLAGIIIGPSVLRLIHEIRQIEVLAEIGVVLLLFTIGLEFPMSRLKEMRRYVLWGGGLQIILTSGAVTGLALLKGCSFGQAAFFGFLISLSSTAIVLKIYGARGELITLYGNFVIAVLLFQDLCIVPMMLLMPILGAQEVASWSRMLWPFLMGLTVIGLMIGPARLLLPKIIDQVVRLKNQEIFTLFIIFFCLTTAWLTSRFGLSLALGAFIAGLLLSESEYSHQAFSNVLPLRDSFAGLFFISIGMLLNLRSIVESPWTILQLTLFILGLKILIAFTVMILLRMSFRTSVNGSMALAQIGEFSFLLAQTGLYYHLMSPRFYQQFLASAIISMMATPFLIQIAPRFGFYLQPILGWLDIFIGAKPLINGEDKSGQEGHVVIIGYGESGRNLARVLQATAIPYIIVDLDIINIRQAKKSGQPIFYGDAGSSQILKKVGIPSASMAVVAISDSSATRRILWLIRRMNPQIFLLTRTRNINEIEELYKLGANQVISEEFETSIEIFSHVLRQYHVPRNMIAIQVQLVRSEGYQMLRELNLTDLKFKNIQHLIAETLTETFMVLPESPAVGKTLGELNLRLHTGASVIAVIRGNKSIPNPGANTEIKSDDILVMMGNHAALDEAIGVLSP